MCVVKFGKFCCEGKTKFFCAKNFIALSETKIVSSKVTLIITLLMIN